MAANVGAKIELLIPAIIVYSLVTMAMETMPELSAYTRLFQISETIVVGLFTIEYMARWGLSKNKLKYPLSFFAIVDLLSILPFYLSLGMDLRGVRVVRLLRIFRILRLSRYSDALQTLGQAFQRTGPELAAFALIGAIVIIMSSTAIYYAEHDAQPDTFSSIPASIWWAIVTLTTVGYGDSYPSTAIGKMVASAVMITGIGFIAIPTGLLSSAMTEIIREKRESTRSAMASSGQRSVQ